MKSRHVIAVSAAIVLATGFLAGSAGATPAEGEIVRTDIAEGTTDTPISIVTDGEETTFYVQGLDLKPGASSGWHAHPGPEYSVVRKGVVDLWTANHCAPVEYGADEAVFIPAGISHVVVNEGPEDAEVLVTYTLPAGVAVRDDAPPAC